MIDNIDEMVKRLKKWTFESVYAQTRSMHGGRYIDTKILEQSGWTEEEIQEEYRRRTNAK